MPKIYLASPLGFSPEFKPYLERIKARLVQLGREIFDPWEQSFSKAIHKAPEIEDYHERVAAFARYAVSWRSPWLYDKLCGVGRGRDG